ncbi:TPA: hypothetical protein OT652_003183 [Morganella morganii]|nr:hypothetical protein [Morganella morganii]
MKSIAALLFILLPFQSIAKCWVVANLHGYSAYQNDEFNYKKNGMSNSIFHVLITKNKADLSLVGDTIGISGLSYAPVSKTSMVGFNVDGDMSVIESWAITGDNKVLYTKTINDHEIVTGTSSFVGDVVGSCD